MGLLLVSRTVAAKVCAVFSATLMLEAPAGWLVAESWMEAGGQVEKKPEFSAEDELETVAVTSAEPGWLAVTVPCALMVAMLVAPWSAKAIGPTWQVMLCPGSVKPPE